MTETEKDAFLPLLLRHGREPDSTVIESLRENPSIIVRDILLSCLRDLVATRNPQKKLSSTEIDKLVIEHLAGVSPDKYGVWALYQWNQTLVHLPTKEEFIELRTNRNKYKISDEEEGRLAKAKVGIIGLSVGNAVTMALTLERGCGELRVADLDTIELSNLNRIQMGVHAIGMSKAILAARQIAEIDPFLKVSCFSQGVTKENISEFFGKNEGALDLVIDECDSIYIKVRVREEARARGIPVLMATSERGMLDVERFDLEPERQIFHGLVGDINRNMLEGLTTEEKIPYVLKILGVEAMSSRMRASMLEIGSSITTWPQLASSVMLGGAMVADTARRILLGEKIPSGRYFVDFNSLVSASSPARGFVLNKNESNVDVTEMKHTKSSVAFPTKETVSSFASQLAWGRTFLGSLRTDPKALPLGKETVRALVADAITAPSGGNVQPWIWLYQSPVLLLMLDKERSESILDFNRTASIAALGATTENIVLSAHRKGLEVHVGLFTDLPGNMVFASFEFFNEQGKLTQSHTYDSLYESIGMRKTNRRTGTRQSLPFEALYAIKQAAESVSGAKLCVMSSDNELEELGCMLGASDRMRMLNKRLHEEMMTEMRFTEDEALTTRDGISVADLDLGPLDRAGLMLCRDWNTLSFMKRWGSATALEKMSR